MTVTERLAEIRARAEAATDGPWGHWPEAGDIEVFKADPAHPNTPGMSPTGGEHILASIRPRLGWGGEIYERTGRRPGGDEPDAEFIAHARTDVPALVKALEAVLEEHRPVHRIFSWSSGIRDEEPCPDCHGKAGVHDCGCWADEDITYSCATCRTDRGGGVDYPCPTVQAINEALGEDQS